MIVKVEDLKKGDEFLIAGSGAHFRYYKALEDATPSYMKDANGNKVVRKDWRGRDKWKALRCTTNCTVTESHYTDYNMKVYTNRRYDYKCTPEGHNYKESINLNYKEIWLVKREQW